MPRAAAEATAGSVKCRFFLSYHWRYRDGSTPAVAVPVCQRTRRNKGIGADLMESRDKKWMTRGRDRGREMGLINPHY